MSVLRASSLAAVTSLVWSTKESPVRAAASRTRRLTTTMSGSDTTGIVSLSTTDMTGRLMIVERYLQQLHASIDVQSRPHTGKRHTQFHQRDCDCGLHSDDDGLCVKHPRHRGDVAQHSTNERVHNLKT